jgi:ATP-dependent 26S proteasome regulatory subunit
MANGQGLPTSVSSQQQQQVSSYMSSQQRNSMNSSVSQEVQRVVNGMSPTQISQIPYMSAGIPGANITQILTLLSMYIYNLPTFKSFGVTFPPQIDALLSTSTTGASSSSSPSQVVAQVAYALNKLKTESVTNLNYFMNNGQGNPTNMTAQQQQQIAPNINSPNTQAILNGIPQEAQRVVNAMSATEKSQIPYSQTGVTKPDITAPLIQLARFSYLAPMYRSVGVTFPAQFNTLA